MNRDGEPGPHPLRLFFALWPSAGHRQALTAATAAAVAQVDGQAVPARNFHVTLAFLGMVPGRTFARLVEIGGQGGYPMFDISFDRFEYWPRPKVLVVMASRVPTAGPEMVDRLWHRILPLGFEREARPWRPHLTLVRRVRRLPPDGLSPLSERIATSENPAPWGLALVESVTHPDGPHYRPLAEWPLGD